MKILVTGATGGLGATIIDNLLKRGVDVIATSRDIEKAKQSDFYDKVTYLPHDIYEDTSKDLFIYFQKPDAIIHCAWEKLGAAEYKNPLHTSLILGKHKAFLTNLINHGLKDITVVGTCYEYGLKEGVLKEDDPSSPTVEYSISKNLLREYLQTTTFVHPIQWKWVRVFYVFGEVKGRKNLYTHLIEAVKKGEASFNMSGGEQIRDAGLFVDLLERFWECCDRVRLDRAGICEHVNTAVIGGRCFASAAARKRAQLRQHGRRQFRRLHDEGEVGVHFRPPCARASVHESARATRWCGY